MTDYLTPLLCGGWRCRGDIRTATPSRLLWGRIGRCPVWSGGPAFLRRTRVDGQRQGPGQNEQTKSFQGRGVVSM